MQSNNLSDILYHLVELRSRLIWAILSIVAATAIMLPFANRLYLWLALPLIRTLAEQNGQMIATEVASPFLTPFKLALIAGILAALPVIFYQLWAFVAPGLYKKEKRLLLPLLAGSVILFYCGGLFVYFVVFPLVFSFLIGVAPAGVQVATDINHYLNFTIKMFFAFGLAFQVPIAVILLVITEVVDADALAKKRPYVVVGVFLLGMLLTPPDVISQTLLAVPMWLLFEVGIVLGKWLKQTPRAQAAPTDGGGAGRPEQESGNTTTQNTV